MSDIETRLEIAAHVNDAMRMMNTPGGKVSFTSVRGLIEGIRYLASREQRVKAMLDFAEEHNRPTLSVEVLREVLGDG